MPPDQQDAWETETLTPINDAEVTVVDAYFEEGKFGTQIVWVMRIDVPHDPIDIAFETCKAWYSCGKDWVIQDAGASVIKPTSDPSKPAKIHASSNYGKIMDRVLKIGVDMRGRGLPTEARVWKDLRFHMQREEVKYTGLPTLKHVRHALQQFVLFYNKVRPHQGIGYLTPYEFCSEIGIRP